MEADGEWSIEYYVAENGKSPVREFLLGLDEKTQARLLQSFDWLKERNIHAREPLVKHIEGKLWKLREESNTNIYRVFYVFFAGKRIVLLHGFTKKTQKTPRGEIETALKYLSRYEAIKGGKS
jgi:phage-related protein